MTKQALRKQITKSSKIKIRLILVTISLVFICQEALKIFSMILYDELIQTNTCKIDGIIIKQAYKTNYRKFEDTYI